MKDSPDHKVTHHSVSPSVYTDDQMGGAVQLTKGGGKSLSLDYGCVGSACENKPKMGGNRIAATLRSDLERRWQWKIFLTCGGLSTQVIYFLWKER